MSKGDVSWHMLKPKGGFYSRPFAYSTVATSDLITIIANDHPNDTIEQAIQHIHYDAEAVIILQTFVNKGYGDVILANIVSKVW